MKRREVILGTVALVVAPSILRANDPCLADLKRSKLTVGTDDNKGHLIAPIFEVTGWEMNFEEDDKVLFEFRISNQGPKKVRAVHCQPFTFGSWKILKRYPVGGSVEQVSDKVIGGGFRANNDSNFFFIEINSTGNTWVPMSGIAGDSTAGLSSSVRGTMEWHKEQKVVFEIRAKDTRS
jgi:hypothetical protein